MSLLGYIAAPPTIGSFAASAAEATRARTAAAPNSLLFILRVPLCCFAAGAVARVGDLHHVNSIRKQGASGCSFWIDPDHTVTRGGRSCLATPPARSAARSASRPQAPGLPRARRPVPAGL